MPARALPTKRPRFANVVRFDRAGAGVRPSDAMPAEYALGVWGRKKCGKSFRVKKLLETCSRVVAVDVNNEYWHGSSSPRGAGPLREHMYASELALDPYKLEEPNLSLAVVPDDDTPASAARCFMLVSSLARSYAIPVVVVLEENGDWSRYAMEELITFATRGGHKRISFIVVAQRPALMLPVVRSQFDEIWCFQMHEPADVEALEERTRDDAFAEAVRKLDERSMLAWRAGGAAARASDAADLVKPSDAPPPAAAAPSDASSSSPTFPTANPKEKDHGEGT